MSDNRIVNSIVSRLLPDDFLITEGDILNFEPRKTRNFTESLVIVFRAIPFLPWLIPTRRA